MTLSAYWWKPYDTLLNTAISVRRFHRAWFEMTKHHLSFTNFGDAVNESILAELAGRHVRWAPLGRADIVGIGSVLDLVERSEFNGVVLGSGIRAFDLDPTRLKTLEILALRGHRTAELIGRPTVALGDPGLIAREIFPRSGPVRGREPVVIPHYGVLNGAAGRSLLSSFRAQGWRVVLPNRSPKAIAEAVAAAPFVASSSLHGLVFAHSFGTPTAFVDFESTGKAEPTFKYDDYYSVFGLEALQHTAKEVLRTPVSELIDRQQSEQSTIAGLLDDVIDGIYAAARPLRSGS